MQDNPRQLPEKIAAPGTTVTDLHVSTPLWRLLSSNMPADQEISEIASNPELHAEAKRVAPVLREAVKGCGGEAVRRALQPLVLVFGVGGAAEAPGFWRAYVGALEDVPAEALRQAVEDYTRRATSEFFPRPGPLRDIALKFAAPMLKAANRATRAARQIPFRPREVLSVEERREIAERMRIKPVPKGETKP